MDRSGSREYAGGAAAGEIWGMCNIYICDSHIKGGEEECGLLYIDLTIASWTSPLPTQLELFAISMYAGLRICLSKFALSLGEEARRAGRG